MPDEKRTTEPSSGDTVGTAGRWTVLRWIAVAVMVLAALAYLVAIPLGAIPHQDRLATADVVLGVALIVGFAFFGSLTQVDLTPAGVSFKVRTLELRQEALQSELDAERARITRLFLNTMAPSMYEQLKKLRAGGFRDYKKTKDFEREMTNLRDAGYVEDFDWGRIPDNPADAADRADLSTHITITPLGKEFLDLRAGLAKEAGRQTDGG